MSRPIHEIARDCRRDMHAQVKGVNASQRFYAAWPYLVAMMDLDKISDRYGADSAKSVVAYFLSNAGTWKGPRARELKAELKALLTA